MFRLILAGTKREFSQGTEVLREGSVIEEVHLINRGLVSVSLQDGTDPASWLYVSGSGAVVDMSAALDPPVSPVTVRALSKVETLAVPRTAFVELIRDGSEVGYRMLQDHCKRLSLINSTLFAEFDRESRTPSLN